MTHMAMSLVILALVSDTTLPCLCLSPKRTDAFAWGILSLSLYLSISVSFSPSWLSSGFLRFSQLGRCGLRTKLKLSSRQICGASQCKNSPQNDLQHPSLPDASAQTCRTGDRTHTHTHTHTHAHPFMMKRGVSVQYQMWWGLSKP